MDCRTTLKKSIKGRKTNTDTAPEQEKKIVYFSNDLILEAVKFLNYEKWSQMRFLCLRVNNLIQSNQSKLQAFEVTSLGVSQISRSSNSIVSFDLMIEQADDVRKWFQDRGYSCDETTDIPLDKLFVGINPSWGNGLRFIIRAFFEDSTEKNMSLTRGQTKGKNLTGNESSCLSSDMTLRSGPPELFSAEFNAKYEFYGPILSHFFRLLHHPNAYFREVSMFPPMTDKFCDIASKNPIRCEQFTLRRLDSSVVHSFKWLKDNVRAQNIALEFSYDDIPYLDLHVSDFILLDASICAGDCIILYWLLDPVEFVKILVKKYETLEVTKTIPSILLEVYPPQIEQYFESNLVRQDNPSVVGKFCDKCVVNKRSYILQNKIDKNRKMIAQVKHCSKCECVYSTYNVHISFE